jgi:hypothetical protein
MSKKIGDLIKEAGEVYRLEEWILPDRAADPCLDICEYHPLCDGSDVTGCDGIDVYDKSDGQMLKAGVFMKVDPLYKDLLKVKEGNNDKKELQNDK